MTPTSVDTWGPFALTLSNTDSPSLLAQTQLAQTHLAQSDAPSTSGTGPGAQNTQAPGQPGNNAPANNNGGGLFGSGFLLMMAVLFVVMLLITSMGNKKRDKARQALMDSLSKGDRVQTVGGILGTVVEIKDNEVLLKVDENANTKLKFVRSAIQTVLTDKTPEEPAK